MKHLTLQTIIILFLLFSHSVISGQEDGKGIIEGRILNTTTNQPVEFASIVIWGTTIGSVSDLNGRFLFTGIKPGYVELRVSSVGFKPYVSEPILVTNANRVNIEYRLKKRLSQSTRLPLKYPLLGKRRKARCRSGG